MNILHKEYVEMFSNNSISLQRFFPYMIGYISGSTVSSIYEWMNMFLGSVTYSVWNSEGWKVGAFLYKVLLENKQM